MTGLAFWLIVAAILVTFLLRRLGLGLVLLSLAAFSTWGEDVSTGGRWFFWILFILTLFYTAFAGSRFTRRRGTGVGLAMLVFTLVLVSDWHISRPFDGSSGILTTLLLVAGLMIALMLLGVILPLAIVAGVIMLGVIAAGALIGFFNDDIDVPSATPSPSLTVPVSPTSPPSSTTTEATGSPSAWPTDTPSSVHLDDPEVPDEIKGSAPPTSTEYLQPDMPIVDWDQDRTAIPEED